MFEYKKISQNDLEEVIKIASLRIGVNEVILEKDYWVCFVLNYLFSKCKWKDAFTFKGGTSLSKCFGLIQRFSEDIDLMNRGWNAPIQNKVNLIKNPIKRRKNF